MRNRVKRKNGRRTDAIPRGRFQTARRRVALRDAESSMIASTRAP
jgi:hypothetical protein